MGAATRARHFQGRGRVWCCREGYLTTNVACNVMPVRLGGPARQGARLPPEFENEMSERLTDMIEDVTGRKVLTYQPQVLFEQRPWAPERERPCQRTSTRQALEELHVLDQMPRAEKALAHSLVRRGAEGIGTFGVGEQPARRLRASCSTLLGRQRASWTLHSRALAVRQSSPRHALQVGQSRSPVTRHVNALGCRPRARPDDVRRRHERARRGPRTDPGAGLAQLAATGFRRNA